jgi:hypothetical protein
MTYRSILLLGWTLFCSNLHAQYYNNVNNELCFELYRSTDALSEYRVYMVIDKETTQPEDTVILAKWPSVSLSDRISRAQRWAMLGRRIEIERAPYITKEPRFEQPAKKVEWKRDVRPIDWHNSPWKDAKQFWCCPDRPF